MCKQINIKNFVIYFQTFINQLTIKEMKEQEEKDMMLREVAITGFQQLLDAGIANSIAGVFGEHEDGELLSIITLFSLKSDTEMIELMKKFTYAEIESFLTDEDDNESGERHPALCFLDKILTIIVRLERKTQPFQPN